MLKIEEYGIRLPDFSRLVNQGLGGLLFSTRSADEIEYPSGSVDENAPSPEC